MAKKEKKEAKAKKAEPETKPCACGCGAECKNTFAPGHDGRVHGWFVRIRELHAAGLIHPDQIAAPHIREAYARWDGTGAVSKAFHAE